jgi:hypothetical protein
MKRISALSLLIVAFLSTASAVLSQESGLKANIPFNFAVGDTWMPAGEYKISAVLYPIVQLQKVDGGATASVIAHASRHESRSGSQLVFNQYGGRYFLQRILCPTDSSMNVEVTGGKAERRARMLEAGLHGGEETQVAAK